MKHVFKNPNQELEVTGIGKVNQSNLTEEMYRRVMAVSPSFGEYFIVQTDNAISDIDELADLRKDYLSLSGKSEVDKRWGEDKLKSEIKKLKSKSDEKSNS